MRALASRAIAFQAYIINHRVRPLTLKLGENGEELCIWVCFSFFFFLLFFVLHAKSDTTNNHLREVSGLSY